MPTEATDWEGRPVPADESPDTRINVWQISPHPTDPAYDFYVERSWQAMLKYMRSGFEGLLERHEFVDGKNDALDIKVELVEMTLSEYDDIINA
ncbi:hypothetical protein [Fimbriiglobus ruber]|uniref:Uncharacterized protein n=1 Tax=Fimbriiglobus ruber TaxID=1908690 RepID=A0A225D3P4_9BACT|nr:hypothetical protein [Fimbriiglobus ruber]OWK34254.1 hypothetical protein FRUB_10225 [Fimbriiglobus ruber]